MKPSEIKTPADLIASVQAWGATHMTAMNGLLDKMPEGMKADFLTLKGDLNDILAKLKPLDSVPAAMDASYALNSFASTINYLMEHIDNFRTKMATFTDELSKKSTALNGLEKQIESGELLPKDKYTPLIDAAKAKGVEETMATFVTGTRKTMIATAGLPEADAGTLALGVAEFDAAFAQAKTNVGALGKKGLTLANKGKSWVTDLAWKPLAAFQGRLTEIEELIGGFKAPAAAGGDPLLGAGGAGGAAAEPVDQPRKLILA